MYEQDPVTINDIGTGGTLKHNFRNNMYREFEDLEHHDELEIKDRDDVYTGRIDRNFGS